MQVSCQCGAVHFKTPTPTPIKLYHCHCTQCRHQSASAFGTSAAFPTFSLPIDTQPLKCWTRMTASGARQECWFCSTCGCRIVHKKFYPRSKGDETTRDDKWVEREYCVVKGGCINGLDWSKATHIWCSEAVVEVPANATRFEREPPE